MDEEEQMYGEGEPIESNYEFKLEQIRDAIFEVAIELRKLREEIKK